MKVVGDEHVNVAMDLWTMSKLWHYRFRHLGLDNNMKLVNGKMVEGMDNAVDKRSVICEACEFWRAAEPFEVIHSDVCGPICLLVHWEVLNIMLHLSMIMPVTRLFTS